MGMPAHSDVQLQAHFTQLTPTITLRGVERTDALETEILTRLRKLEACYTRIMGCRVLVELAWPSAKRSTSRAASWRIMPAVNAAPSRSASARLAGVFHRSFPSKPAMGAFDLLAVESAISFVEQRGEKEPRASTVKLLHGRRIHRASHATAGTRVVR